MSLLQFSLSCLHAQLKNLEADFSYWRDLTKAGAKLPQHNSQVDRITKTLAGTRSAALAKTPLEPKQPTGEPDVESVKATLGDLPGLRRSVGTIHLLWEFFRDKLAQRLVDAVDVHLGVGDDLAWDCYKPCLDAAVGDDPEKRVSVKEPPLVFYSTDRTAFAQARTKTFHPLGLDSIDVKQKVIAEVLQSLPVPVVGIPWASANRLPDLVVLGHEVGHVVAEDLGLAADAKRLLQSIDYPRDPGEERKRVWEKWSDEVFGDVFGVFATGQAFVDALGGEFAGNVNEVRGQSINRQNPGLYPTPTLRMAICEALLRRLGITPSPMWSADFGALTGNSWAFEKDVDLVVDALVDKQWAGLGGKKLGEVLPWNETQETNAKAVADDYLLLSPPSTSFSVRVWVAGAMRAWQRNPMRYIDKSVDSRMAKFIVAQRGVGVRSLHTRTLRRGIILRGRTAPVTEHDLENADEALGRNIAAKLKLRRAST